MIEFKGTSIGFEFEFGKLRIVDGGEPKTVLFTSKEKSDAGRAKLMMVTVDIATGGDATTEVISGPICTSETFDAMKKYLIRLHQAVEACRRERKIMTRDRVRAKIDGTERDDGEEEEEKEDEQAETKAELDKVAAEVPAAAASSGAVQDCFAPPPPPPSPPEQRPVVRKEVPDEEKPRFEAPEGWFNSVPQVNLGIQIRTVGGNHFNTYDFLCRNLPGLLPDLYKGIVAGVDGYLFEPVPDVRGPLVPEGCADEKKEDVRGVIVLYALLAANLTFLGVENLDAVDNKKVPYKESWGLLPKVVPVSLWQAIKGEETLRDYWKNVKDGASGEAGLFVQKLFPAGVLAQFPGRVAKPSERIRELLVGLAAKTVAGDAWKAAPNAPPPFKIKGRIASVWEMRLSAVGTRKMSISGPNPPEIFSSPDEAEAFLKSCWALTEKKG